MFVTCYSYSYIIRKVTIVTEIKKVTIVTVTKLL